MVWLLPMLIFIKLVSDDICDNPRLLTYAKEIESLIQFDLICTCKGSTCLACGSHL